MSDFNNIEDTFRDAFSNWEPDHSGADMNQAWQKVSQHIPVTPQAPGASVEAAKGLLKNGLSGGKLALITGTAAVIIGAAALLFNANNSGTKSSSNPSTSATSSAATTGNTTTKPTESKTSESGKTTDNTSSDNKSPVHKFGFYSIPHLAPNAGNIFSNSGAGKNSSGSQSSLNLGGTNNALFPTDNNSGNTGLTHKDMALMDTSICESNDLLITNESGKRMIISWGDGIQNLAFGNLSHHYSKTGRYELSIECDGYTITRNVTIKAAPIARFSYYSTQAMTCKFKNQSENADYSKWEFGDRSSDETRGNAMEKHSYSDTGIQTVKLTARSADGCSSVLQKDIRVRDTRLFVPEILIPGGASENNVFDVSIEGENEFGLTITDANGQLVFRTNDKNRKWDGNDMSGRPCKAGVYVYLLSYQYSGEDRVESNGTVLLKR